MASKSLTRTLDEKAHALRAVKEQLVSEWAELTDKGTFFKRDDGVILRVVDVTNSTDDREGRAVVQVAHADWGTIPYFVEFLYFDGPIMDRVNIVVPVSKTTTWWKRES